jgi:hypothetical protein
MDGQLDLTRRRFDSTGIGAIRDLERQFESPPPPIRANLVRRFADWVDPETGTVGTGGGVARAVVCAFLCVVATLVLVGALTGAVVAIGRLATLI